jgi:putative transposase
MERHLPMAVVCRVLGAPRSTVYARRQQAVPARTGHRNLRPRLGATDPSGPGRLAVCWGGYRKVRARLLREPGVYVGGKRVLRLLRREGLLASQGARGRANRDHMTATIILEAPNQRWGTDATMAWTRSDGWVWVFARVDHYTAEAWAHVA